MSAVTTCSNCHHAARPLPTDWTAVEFFDRPVIAQEAVFRTTCTAVPDAEKPCLKPAALADRQQMLCLDAVFEVDAIARALPSMVTASDAYSHQDGLMVRALAGRLLRLSSVLMSALGQDGEPIERLERIVTLECGQG